MYDGHQTAGIPMQTRRFICAECFGNLQGVTCLPYHDDMSHGAFSHNIVFEKMSQKLLFPCEYKICGCKAMIFAIDKKAHELNCEYKMTSCPCAGPSVRGRAK